MKKNSKKLIAIMLLLLIAVPLFASCKPGDDPGTVTGDGTTINNEGPKYPNVNYGGDDFTMLISGHTGVNKFNDFSFDESSSSVLDTAIYQRNLAVEQQFGVKIVTIEDFLSTPNAKNLVIRNQTSGDNLYDAVMPVAADVTVLAYSGYLYDLASLPTVDLSRSWWDQKANKDLNIKGIMFFTTGDFGIWANDVTYCIVFNKDLASKYNVPNLYDIVKKGEWTIDKMAEVATMVSDDLDANGVYDHNDLFGLTTWDDAIYGIVNAANEKCCSINDEGTIVLSLNNQRVFSAIEKYMAFYTQKDHVINFQHTKLASHDVALSTLFGGNQSLMLMIMFKNLATYRDLDLDYGIIPYPKLDAIQESYATTIAPWHTNFLAVPYMIEDDVKSGTILEALTYESSKTITPAYYDKTLVGRSIRDDESVEMLDIIFNTRVFDIGYYYQPGGINGKLITEIVRKNSSDFSSVYATYENAANAALKEINAFFAIATEEWHK